MSVNGDILSKDFGFGVIRFHVGKYCAMFAGLIIKIITKLIIVVSAVQNRIINVGSLYTDPGDSVFIYRH